jgi:hypothetical protein
VRERRAYLRDDVVVPVVGRSQEQSFVRGLGGERERSEGVHDHVDPEHLDGGQDGVLRVERGDEDDNDCDHVDGELELEELPHGVVDVPAPLDGLDDGSKVIVEQDDIGGLSGDLGPGVAHREADVGPLERGRVVGPVAGHGDHLPVLDQADHHRVLVLGTASGDDVELFVDRVELVLELERVNDDGVLLLALALVDDDLVILELSGGLELGDNLLPVDLVAHLLVLGALSVFSLAGFLFGGFLLGVLLVLLGLLFRGLLLLRLGD